MPQPTQAQPRTHTRLTAEKLPVRDADSVSDAEIDSEGEADCNKEEGERTGGSSSREVSLE